MTIPERHLGDTRSGKRICIYDTNDTTYIHEKVKEFEKSDYFDGFCLFQFMTLRAVRKYGKFSDEAKQMEFMGIYHLQNINEEFIAHEKKLLSLVTSIDIRNHGESLVKHLLRK